MKERHLSQLVQNLIDRFEYYGAHKFKLDNELSQLVHPVTRERIAQEFLDLIEQKLLDKIKYRRAHDTADITPVSVVSDLRDHEEWYPAWKDANDNLGNSYYWKRLENFLSTELTGKYGPESAGKVVKSIDDATYRIMDKLACPIRREFSYKGLVLGYVQSGKTANFTALIAKAADAGYKLIIVLAGIHNVLRRQTQMRLDQEITGVRDIDVLDNYIPLPGSAKMWNRLTTAHNDFSNNNIGRFENYCRLDTPTLAVIKKNVSVLDRIIGFFSQASEALRSEMPVLIIDDEADQASIDGNANDPESDPTRTNEKIRTILSLFSKRAYIGYTATPFANVLIDMASDHPVLSDDLYPRNFIISLPEPEGYFGTSTIFAGTLADVFVNEIQDEANELIRHGVMTDHLSRAVDQFIVSCAIRNLRGDKMKPMSMLVHVSHRISDMVVLNTIITEYMETIIGRYKSRAYSKDLKSQFKSGYGELIERAQRINRERKSPNRLPDFDSTWAEIANVLKVLTVVELNSESEDRLDYTTGEEIKVIAIGGNQLSRGLTLEGLMTSYYLRASRQYDTLLQMGRWFGYRNRYEDLTRVHTTETIWEFFEHLALVEDELRSEVYRYEEQELTPMEMAVAIRAHSRLKVTAPNKMGAAQDRQISYSDSLNQTIWFPLDKPELLKENYKLATAFIKSIGKKTTFTKHGGVWLANDKVDGEVVLEKFLNRYNFIPKTSSSGPGLDAENLLGYIFRRMTGQSAELTQWSIALVGNANPTATGDPLNFGGLNINRIQRSRKYTESGFNIGVLTEQDHLAIDLMPGKARSPQNPLLLIYVVWHGSKAAKPKAKPLFGERIDLYQFVRTEPVDVVGVAIVLPPSRVEPNSYIGQFVRQ